MGAISPPRRERDERRIRKIVDKLKDHPSLPFWETLDEPAFQWKKLGVRVPVARRSSWAAYRILTSAGPAISFPVLDPSKSLSSPAGVSAGHRQQGCRGCSWELAIPGSVSAP